MEFEWDPKKAAANLTKHGVSFQEATTVFDNLLSVTVPDPDHSFEEHRLIIVGESHRGRVLIVSHVERGERIRIVSARELTRAERDVYERRNFD